MASFSTIYTPSTDGDEGLTPGERVMVAAVREAAAAVREAAAAAREVAAAIRDQGEPGASTMVSSVVWVIVGVVLAAFVQWLMSRHGTVVGSTGSDAEAPTVAAPGKQQGRRKNPSRVARAPEH